MDKVHIGGIQKPHGIKGEVKIFSLTDFPNQRFKKGQSLTLMNEKTTLDVVVSTFRMHHETILVSFKGYTSMNDAMQLKGMQVYIADSKRHKLDKDDFYHSDLVGCEALCDGEVIGTVSEVIDLPAHPVIRVTRAQGDILIPFNKVFVERVNVKDKTLEINWMEGLDEN